MKIIMVGGPYDNEAVNVEGDERNPPLTFLNMPPKLEPITTAIPKNIVPRKAPDLLKYKLEMVFTSPDKWHYEYHYQGR